MAHTENQLNPLLATEAFKIAEEAQIKLIFQRQRNLMEIIRREADAGQKMLVCKWYGPYLVEADIPFLEKYGYSVEKKKDLSPAGVLIDYYIIRWDK